MQAQHFGERIKLLTDGSILFLPVSISRSRSWRINNGDHCQWLNPISPSILGGRGNSDWSDEKLEYYCDQNPVWRQSEELYALLLIIFSVTTSLLSCLEVYTLVISQLRIHLAKSPRTVQNISSWSLILFNDKIEHNYSSQHSSETVQEEDWSV